MADDRFAQPFFGAGTWLPPPEELQQLQLQQQQQQQVQVQQEDAQPGPAAAAERKYTKHVIQRPLNSVLQQGCRDQLGAAIELVVRRCTQMWWEALVLVRLHVLRLLELSPLANVGPLDNNFFRVALQCVSTIGGSLGPDGAAAFEGIYQPLYETRDQLYFAARQRDHQLPFQPRDGMDSILTYAAQQMATNCYNHVTTNFRSRLRSYMVGRLQQIPGLPSKRVATLAELCTGTILRFEPGGAQLAARPPNWATRHRDLTAQQRGAVEALLDGVTGRWSHLLPANKAVPLGGGRFQRCKLKR